MLSTCAIYGYIIRASIVGLLDGSGDGLLPRFILFCTRIPYPDFDIIIYMFQIDYINGY